jgi:hypothetical protein
MGRFERPPGIQGAAGVDLDVASYAVIGGSADLTSSTHQVYATPWSLLGAGVVVRGTQRWREAVIQRHDGERRLMWWWYSVGGHFDHQPCRGRVADLGRVVGGETAIARDCRHWYAFRQR